MVGHKAEASPDKMIFPFLAGKWEAKLTLCLSNLEWLFLQQKVIINALLSPSTTTPFNPFLQFYLSLHSFDDSRIK